MKNTITYNLQNESFSLEFEPGFVCYTAAGHESKRIPIEHLGMILKNNIHGLTNEKIPAEIKDAVVKAVKYLDSKFDQL